MNRLALFFILLSSINVCLDPSGKYGRNLILRGKNALSLGVSSRDPSVLPLNVKTRLCCGDGRTWELMVQLVFQAGVENQSPAPGSSEGLCCWEDVGQADPGDALCNNTPAGASMAFHRDQSLIGQGEVSISYKQDYRK